MVAFPSTKTPKPGNSLSDNAILHGSELHHFLTKRLYPETLNLCISPSSLQFLRIP